MKELHGRAADEVHADPRKCLALLGDVERYAEWYPDVVRSVEVLERGRGGEATRARAVLAVSRGPLKQDFTLLLEVTRADGEVRLTRVPHEPSDEERFIVHWQVDRAGNGSSRLALDLDAALDVPRFVPLGGIGDSVAEGFVAAAVRVLEDPANGASRTR